MALLTVLLRPGWVRHGTVVRRDLKKRFSTVHCIIFPKTGKNDKGPCVPTDGTGTVLLQYSTVLLLHMLCSKDLFLRVDVNHQSSS